MVQTTKKQDEDKYNKNTTQYVLDTTIYKKQDEDKYNKTHNTICVGHHYAQRSKNNVNKTRVLLQTSGGKDEPFSTYHQKKTISILFAT